MSIHQHNPSKKPDSEFIKGNISFLKEGNVCRLLDGRRTPGFIEKINYESGMFRWRITDFEDKDNYWDLPFEKVTSYQFEKTCIPLSESDTELINEIILKYNQPLNILCDEEDFMKTNDKINHLKTDITHWLKSKSKFIASGESLDFNSNIGPSMLSDDLVRYMKEQGLDQLELKTADTIVLNPNSGEWIKGMSIVLAELGLVSYHGKIQRTKDIFSGIGSKDLRESYILHRLAFIRGLFDLLEITHVPLYRGMCSEVEWRESKNTFVSFTFDSNVANSFSGFEGDNNFRNAYLIKSTVDISKLFMSYLETKQMNERYKEAEALLFNNLKIII